LISTKWRNSKKWRTSSTTYHSESISDEHQTFNLNHCKVKKHQTLQS